MSLDFKLLEEKPLKLSDDKLREYIFECAKSTYNLININKMNKIQRGGLAYTSFIPTDVSFKGYWAPYSPTIFWGLRDDEKEKAILSSFIYYSLFPNARPFTELWIEIISSILPYNLLIEFNTNCDFELKVDQEIRLIKIKCSNNLFDTLTTFLNSIYDSINNENGLKSKILGSVDVKEDAGHFCYDFKSIQNIIKINNQIKNFLNNINKTNNNLLDKANQLSNILKQELISNLKAKLDSFDDEKKKMDEMSKIILKLLMIGPEPTKHLLLINPKQFKNGKYIGCLGVIIRNYDYDNNDENIYNLYTEILPYLDIVAFRITTTYLFGFFKKQALNSAIAAIMSRNLAHHIDSHIRPRTSLEKVLERLRELTNQKIVSRPDNPDNNEWKIINTLNDRLESYISEREAFIAEVSSEPLTTTKRLNFYRDIILRLVQNTLFMDNIAKNEGINYKDNDIEKNRLQIKFYRDLNNDKNELKAIFSCCPSENDDSKTYRITYPEQGFPFTSHCIVRDGEMHTCHEPSDNPQILQIKEIENFDKDVAIELPGSIGEQAIYAFLENLIRNAAKHNSEELSKNKDLWINILVSESDSPDFPANEFYRVKIWDSVTDPDKEVAEKEIEQNGKKTKKHITLEEKINNLIQSSPIKEDTGELKKEAWGIAEMKIMATLLAGSTDWMNMSNYLYVKNEKDPITNENHRLVYELYLMKPKKLAIISPRAIDQEIEESLKNQGIWNFSSFSAYRQYWQEKTNGDKKNKSIANFDFVVLDCREEGQITNFEQFVSYLPFRTIVVANQNSHSTNWPKAVLIIEDNKFLENIFARLDEIGKETNEGNRQKILDNLNSLLWRTWLSRWDEGDENILEVYLDQENCNVVPTSLYSKIADSFNQSPFQLRTWRKSDPFSAPCNEVTISKVKKIKHVIFDRHGVVLHGMEKNIGARFDGTFGKQNTYLGLDKLSPDFVEIFAEPNAELLYKMLEAGLLRVLIIDERLTEACYEPKKGVPDSGNIQRKFYSTQFMRWHAAFAAKIYIATHLNISLNDEPKPLHLKAEDMEVQIKNTGNVWMKPPYLKVKVMVSDDWTVDDLISEWVLSGKEEAKGRFETKDFDMLIIHQGVLDRIRDDNEKAFDQEIFLSSLRKLIPFVIVNSGRGVPVEVQNDQNTKFLPFVILQQCLMGERISKLKLSEISMKLTREMGGKSE